MKIYCNVCNKFKNSKISFIFKRTLPLDLSIVYSKCGHNHKKVYRVLNYVEHLLILISTISRSVSISNFASLVGIPIGVTNSGIGLKMSVITAG